MHLVDWIAGADQTDEFRLLSRWFAQVCQIRERFAQYMALDFDPLASNETASVGFLAAAASRAGFLTLTDYVSVKRGWEARVPYRLGRCDLWLADPLRQRSWAFEFKQGMVGRGTGPEKLGKLLDLACFDARRIDRLEADHRFGALVVSVHSNARNDRLEERLQTLSSRASYCCRICGGVTPVWIYLEGV